MNINYKNKDEYDHFSKIAQEWWLPEGQFKILHEILPLRLEYILKNCQTNKIKDWDILDLGCGGGLVCEPLCRLGAKVTGIDFIEENIKIAKIHASKANLKINYLYEDLEKINLKKKYNVILLLEVLEHLDQWPKLIKKIKKNLKKNGILIISTINQTYLAKIFGIFMAENILRWVPKNTHHYDKLIKPKDLKEILIKNNFFVENLEGLNFNPISREWDFNKNLYPINYFCTARLN